MQGYRAAALVLVPLWAFVPPADSAQLSFAEAMERRRAGPQEIELERFIAEAQRVAAGGRSRAAEGPTTSVEGGTRDGREGPETDLSLRIEMPVLASRGERRALGGLLPEEATAMRRGARAAADAELADAFVAAWLAQAVAEVRRQDVSAVETWLSAARRRAEAGADPPYEPTLVAGELDRARVEMIEALRSVELSWGELAARSDVSARPQALDLGGLPGGGTHAHPSSAAAGGHVQAGIESRRRISVALARALTAASSSRWGVAGEVATEGEENLAHIGLAYRLPLHGERSAIAAELTAAEAQAAREAELHLSELAARLGAAAATLASTEPLLDPSDLDAAHAALAARVAEGKERASAVLPLRRQLLEARVAALRSRAARITSGAQLFFLGGEAQR
jgi:hypothetical protein